jgi:hypothetical protein
VEVSLAEVDVLPRVHHDRAITPAEYATMVLLAKLVVPSQIPEDTVSGAGIILLEKRYVTFSVWNKTSRGFSAVHQGQGCLLRRLE